MARLEHCNIRSFDLDETIAFYHDVVGLAGPRADGPATWLYDDSGAAVIHIIPIDRADPDATVARIARRLGPLAGSLDPADWRGGGAVDHIAFLCTDHEAMTAKLERMGLDYRINDIAGTNIRQIFVNDPSGVTLELNFRG